MSKTPIVACPQCSKEVIWNSDSHFRPFCSERCKMIDLGQWASEEYRISEQQPTSDQPKIFPDQA